MLKLIVGAAERSSAWRPNSGRTAARPRNLLLLALAATAPTAWADGDPLTTADGVYTAEQAEKRTEVHEEFCAKCHHYSYYMGSFLLSWQNQPVSALYDLIKLKMPEDRPGSLKPREYAALLAYVFELNGMPAGEEKLAHKPEEMEQILIKDQ